jgi:hypothetical protein
MISLHTELPMSSSCDSLVNAIKPNAKYRFRVSAAPLFYIVKKRGKVK